MPKQFILIAISSFTIIQFSALKVNVLRAQDTCPSRIVENFQLEDVWKDKKHVLILDTKNNSLIIGRVISRQEEGVIFDPDPKSPIYDPGEKYYPFSQIKTLLGSNGKIIYGTIPLQFKKTWFIELTLRPANSLNERPHEISLEPNQPIDVCLPSGNYVISKIYLRDELGNTKQSIEDPNIEIEVEEQGPTHFADIYLENSFFLDKAKIKEMSTHRVRIQTQAGRKYVFTFEDIDQKTKLESWYTYWALGYPVLSYSKSFSEFFDAPIDESALDRTTLSLDFFGFYIPRGEKTLLGFIVNGFEDEYKGNVGGFGVRGITYAFSVMHFLNHRIGQGFFIRGDIGPAKFGRDAIFTFQDNNWGLGFTAGGGFGLPIGKGTRILVNINYDIRLVKNMNHGGLEFSVGGLF